MNPNDFIFLASGVGLSKVPNLLPLILDILLGLAVLFSVESAVNSGAEDVLFIGQRTFTIGSCFTQAVFQS